VLPTQQSEPLRPAAALQALAGAAAVMGHETR
jgi:hypothetical protein